MADKAFRFGVAAVPRNSQQWRGLARRTEELGFSTLLTPDNLQMPVPAASLATAAAVTSRLRVGTFVMATPMRTPRAAAWEAHSISVMTDGRFEFGIGTGVPAMKEAAAELGLPYESASDRLRQISETIDHLRRLDTQRRTPILVAAAGPKARRLAGTKADIVALAGGPLTTREATAAAVREVRDAAGSRADDLELAMSVNVVGEEIPPEIENFFGVDAATMRESDSLMMLRGGGIQDMADELQRRRDAFGASYITVAAACMEAIAPLVARLAGK
ncbi:LLM class flavin-dependent oxidoreductase [Fodinicola feengrottensis]|uniref:LLM class flavin-dependent oxidoreductase n=1 Tax=Fodinicola feengrottensis TaxID=435914 RepID=A0ABN2I393_9ACTN|nr:LLM class flavin-dependent oxidoreductase [Fodinicola feengrottensis]